MRGDHVMHYYVHTYLEVYVTTRLVRLQYLLYTYSPIDRQKETRRTITQNSRQDYSYLISCAGLKTLDSAINCLLKWRYFMFFIGGFVVVFGFLL